jgi:hypothetical protein
MTALLLELDHDRLVRRISSAEGATSPLLSDVVNFVCSRLWTRPKFRQDQILAWLKTGASFDLLRALIEVELPGWRLARLQYDGGQWYCTICRGTAQLEWAAADVTCGHVDPVLAMLRALLEVLAMDGVEDEADEGVLRRQQNPDMNYVLCDNFS